MGMLYGSQIQTMMPKLHSTNFEGMELIRPLYLVREDDIKAWRDYNNLRFIQCACKFTDTCTTCNNEENKSKRVEIKELIKTLKQTNPYVEGNIFKSIENVNLGILHDLDFEMYPEEHCIKEQEIMRERGADMLGWTLDDLITQTIEAMKTFRP